MKLPNPNSAKPYDSESGEYGFRQVDGLEEIVHLPTGQSNMKYYQPEKALNTGNCKHVFRIENMGKREFECNQCGWGVTVNTNQIEETDKGMILKLHQGDFRVSV